MSKHPQWTLYRGWLDRGLYVWSPFVTKVELRLRIANIPYDVTAGSTRSAPKGKIPYIDLVETEQAAPHQIGDSTLIIKELVGRGMVQDLNAKLSPEEKIRDIGIRAILEDKLYFYNGQERWIENYHAQRDKILEALPWFVRPVIGTIIYRKMQATLNGQGTGRYTSEEIASFRNEIWASLNEVLLSSRAKVSTSFRGPFWVLGGAEPTEADCTLFAFVSSVLVCKSCPNSTAFVRGLGGIMDYAGRIHDLYFPDYEKWS